MSYFDPEIYNIKNLTPQDRQIVEKMQLVQDMILNEEKIDEYLSEHYSGKETSKLIKEFLLPYMKFLIAESDYVINDFLIDCIEHYHADE